MAASETPGPDASVNRDSAEFDRRRRLDAVTDMHVLERIGDPVLTSLTRLARSITGASAAAVHIFDERYQRRIAAVGLPLADHPEEDSMCRLVVLGGTRIITSDATAEERFAYSSFVKDPVNPIRFYAAIPLLVGGGVPVGTLCAFDSEPRELTDEQISLLEDVAELARAHLELVKVASDLGKAATLDPLTGTVNRVIFDDRLAQALARRKRHQTQVLVAVIDLNDFKALNDTYGHERGDAALQWVATQLQNSVRSEDTVGRLGGDEFGLVAEVSSGNFDALLEQIARAPEGFEPSFTLSVGAVLAEEGEAVDAVLRRADEAMYAVKRRRQQPQGE
jgi:diguanylate cyclase (GGDEF)-like protein